jgi:hypothetical protein
MRTRWWYDSEAQQVGYLADDGKWFFKTTGEPIGYREGNWIFTPQGAPLGYFDDDEKWIYSQEGKPLGYLTEA